MILVRPSNCLSIADCGTYNDNDDDDVTIHPSMELLVHRANYQFVYLLALIDGYKIVVVIYLFIGIPCWKCMLSVRGRRE